MKTKATSGIVLNEAVAPYRTQADPSPTAAMVRTQIYLTKEEHEFVSLESRRTAKPMASIIREYIDEKMRVPDDAWAKLLEPAPNDPTWKGHEDGGINHDHYVHGTPKRYVKKNGKWVKGPEFVNE